MIAGEGRCGIAPNAAGNLFGLAKAALQFGEQLVVALAASKEAGAERIGRKPVGVAGFNGPNPVKALLGIVGGEHGVVSVVHGV